MTIGVIADTHGKINPGVFRVLQDVDLILHAGDIGSEHVITELESLAPVQAVTGNVDGFPLLHRWPAFWHRQLAGHSVAMTHILEKLDESTIRHLCTSAGLGRRADILIYGHTHVARVEKVAGTLTINPGAAGPARFRLKPSVGLLRLAENKQPEWEIIQLG